MTRKHERQPIVLSLAPTGSTEFPRYRIHDQFLRYWTGESWSLEEDEGTVYEDVNAACTEMQRLLMLPYMDKKVRRFSAPVYLELYGDDDVPLDKVREWLHNVARLFIDAPKFGNGPMEGTLGLTHIQWGQLEEKP